MVGSSKNIISHHSYQMANKREWHSYSRVSTLSFKLLIIMVLIEGEKERLPETPPAGRDFFFHTTRNDDLKKSKKKDYRKRPPATTFGDLDFFCFFAPCIGKVSGRSTHDIHTCIAHGKSLPRACGAWRLLFRNGRDCCGAQLGR